VTILIKTLCTL